MKIIRRKKGESSPAVEPPSERAPEMPRRKRRRWEGLRAQVEGEFRPYGAVYREERGT
jgi:hypothetical protein